ncbi:uncharacterized protein LOC141724931 [Apium graveolens]|uniref:uncharacterized protein LOC141724931 n=1 Tax=Apium graveolens TaxID=4045 RepID=UPI003D7B8125
MTNQPLRKILHRPDISGRLAAWTIELSQFNIEFIPRASTRSQALSDFVVECNFADPEDGEVNISGSKKPWSLFVDGSSIVDSGGAGVILTSPEGFKVQQAIKFSFNVTNNEAEYEALIAGLQLAQHLEVQVIDIFGDSQLVIKQILGEYRTINNRMASYATIVKGLLSSFFSWTLSRIDRSINHWADALSRLTTSDTSLHQAPVYVKILTHSSIAITSTDVNCVSPPQDWRTPIIQYIEGCLLEMTESDKRKIAYKARNYCLENNQLFRRSLTAPLLKCVGEEEATLAMIEVHTRIYGEHLGEKSSL